MCDSVDALLLRLVDPFHVFFCLLTPADALLLCDWSMQLTAQFTAVGGRNFLAELAKREARNEQFQFLKHTHALFSYFTRYYSRWPDIVELE